MQAKINLNKVEKFVNKILDVTDKKIKDFFRKKIDIKYKSGMGTHNPVTEIDIFIENYLRENLLKEFPEFGFIGEEGENLVREEYNWIIDPIDGTTNFGSGIPICGTVINLFQGLKPIFVAQSFPLVNERIVGFSNKITLNDLQIDNEKVKRRLRVSYESSGTNEERAKLVEKLAKNGVPLERYGSAAYGTALVATDRTDALIIENLATWDVAAAMAFAEFSKDLACLKISENELFLRKDNSVDSSYKHTIIFGRKSVTEELKNYI